MTTKAAAIQSFLQGFDIPVYTTASVPDDAVFPYMTYELSIDDFETFCSIPVNIWYRTESEAIPNEKVNQIRSKLINGGATVACDGGVAWICMGSPFAQSIVEDDGSVKRRYVNLEVQFLTID